MWITPALAGDLRRGIRALDFYAAAAPYTGLTLLALEWAAELRPVAVTTTVAGDQPGAYHLGRGVGCFVAERHGRAWMVVKRSPAVRELSKVDYTHDLRYDLGLIALETRRTDGSWQVVLPPRPRTTRFDSAGPLLRVGGRPARAVGRGDLRVGTRGAVVMDATFHPHAGPTPPRRARLRFEPHACGVRIVIPARAGERWMYSAFFRAEPRRDHAQALDDGAQRVQFDAPARVTFARGYSSGADARLVRARIAFAPVADGPISIMICAS